MAEQKKAGGLGRFLERQSLGPGPAAAGAAPSAPAKRASAGKTAGAAQEGVTGVSPKKTARRAAEAADGPRQRRATKGGKEQMLVYLQPSGITELKILAVHDRRSTSDLVADAVNAYLQKRGRPPVA